MAIAIFGGCVAITLGITKWAASKPRSAADFYTAGGGITGFRNGLAITGEYMSAASFIGIPGLVFGSGFDGLIFSIGCSFWVALSVKKGWRRNSCRGL